jgi:hypothetical protein
MRRAGRLALAAPGAPARWLLLLALAVLTLVATVPGRAAGEGSGSAATASADRCVEDTAFMRRNHMELLKHQRVLTVRDGIRTVRHSLANCVACHADKETGSVVGVNSQGKKGFCAGCHGFVGVQLDCFDCHATRPKVAAAGAPAGAPR